MAAVAEEDRANKQMRNAEGVPHQKKHLHDGIGAFYMFYIYYQK